MILKVNLLSARKGRERAVTTRPELISVVAQAAKEAVKVNGQMAEVTYSKCIRCFCCHEVCPEDAIVLRNVKLAVVNRKPNLKSR